MSTLPRHLEALLDAAADDAVALLDELDASTGTEVPELLDALPRLTAEAVAEHDCYMTKYTWTR